MELIDKVIPYTHTNEVFRIWGVGDAHDGNCGFDEAKMNKDIKRIKDDPNSYWIDMGDDIDAINVDDKRFNIMSLDPYYRDKLNNLADAQMDRYCDRIEPIADKCLGKHEGNHEKVISGRYHRDISSVFCNRFKVPNLKRTAMLRLRFHRKSPNQQGKPSGTTIRIFSCHGNIAGRTGGAKVNRLEGLFAMFHADIYMVAHGHKKVTSTASIISVPANGKLKLRTHKKVAMMTGSYLRGYQEGTSTYVEGALYPPSELGAVCVCIKPADGEYWCETN